MNGFSSRIDRFNNYKRIIDLCIVLATLPFTVTVGTVVAIWIRWTMGGPVFFKQQRVGYREEQFSIFKFRTMNTERDMEGKLLPDSRRLTKLGRLLRRSSLDEIPQVINVLRGDMAIIGPRPLLPSYLPFYYDSEKARHLVRPGVTGLAQISGRNDVLWDQRLRYDSEYVQVASLALDAQIVARTLMVVLKRQNVSIIAGESGEPLDVVRQYPMKQGYSLRRFEAVDIPLRVRWFHDQRIREHMSLPIDVSLESTLEWLRKTRVDTRRRDLTIYCCAEGRVVAMAGLKDISDQRFPELYILVDPDLHGQGIGRTSLSLILEWMQCEDRYAGCWLTVAKDNLPAIALYRAVGFKPSGQFTKEGRQRMEQVWGTTSRP